MAYEKLSPAGGSSRHQSTPMTQAVLSHLNFRQPKSTANTCASTVSSSRTARACCRNQSASASLSGFHISGLVKYLSGK